MAQLVIEARDVHRTYEVSRGLFAPPGEVKAVAGVSLALEAGKTLAVVGESGSGKSTLARLLTLIEPPSAGSIFIDGVDVTNAAGAQLRALRTKVQMVFQNPYGSLNPRQTVGATLEEPLLVNTDASAADRRAAAAAMLEKVGLRPEHVRRYPHMFSGGQRQRIAIARALMLRPDIVVLDEPVSALDVSVRAQVLNLLMDLQQEFGLAYIFVSHDLSVVNHIADDVMVLYLGRVVEKGAAKTIFRDASHPYTRALLSATPMADPTRARQRQVLTGEMPSPFDPPSGCVFHPRCPSVFAECPKRVPELRRTDNREVACLLYETATTTA
jgi:dipeptide transport system ATP-binding protein